MARKLFIIELKTSVNKEIFQFTLLLALLAASPCFSKLRERLAWPVNKPILVASRCQSCPLMKEFFFHVIKVSGSINFSVITSIKCPLVHSKVQFSFDLESFFIVCLCCFFFFGVGYVFFSFKVVFGTSDQKFWLRLGLSAIKQLRCNADIKML